MKKIILCITHHNFITVVFVALTHFDEESTSDSSDIRKDIKTHFSRFHDPDFEYINKSGTKIRRDVFVSRYLCVKAKKVVLDKKYCCFQKLAQPILICKQSQLFLQGKSLSDYLTLSWHFLQGTRASVHILVIFPWEIITIQQLIKKSCSVHLW